MPHCRTSTLNDLDDRQNDVLVQLEQLDQQIELLLNDWSAAVKAEILEHGDSGHDSGRAAA